MPKKAIQWFRKAAEQGFATAQNNLGLLYANGWGVPQNLVVAYALFNLSATNDPTDQLAYGNREFVSKRMTPFQLEAGQRLTIDLMKPGNLLKTLDTATGYR